MDNYQSKILNKSKIEFYSENGNEEMEFNDGLVLRQNLNYKLEGYKIVINSSTIDHVIYNGKKYSADPELILIPFDFNKYSKELVVSFKNGIADDCTLPISVVLSNHDKYDELEAKENRKQLNQNIALVLTRGESLINIYFKKANSSVVKTNIKLYFCNKETQYLIDSYESNGEFKSVTGLGYGTYRCVVEQFDSNNHVVASDEKSINLVNDIESLKSELSKSLEGVKTQVRNSGRNTVCI